MRYIRNSRPEFNGVANEFPPARYGAVLCAECGMVANVDPDFHAERYGHAPVVRAWAGKFNPSAPDSSASYRWDGFQFTLTRESASR